MLALKGLQNTGSNLAVIVRLRGVIPIAGNLPNFFIQSFRWSADGHNGLPHFR